MKRLEITLFAMLLVLASCGGSGGGGSPDITAAESGDEKSGLGAGFVPEEPNPGADSVSMDLVSAVGDVLTVGVLITDTDNVRTVSFDVVFSAAAVEYLGYNAGTLLEQGGNSPSYQVTAQSGRIIVGATRAGTSDTDAVGSTTSIELIFRVKQAGDHALTIQNGILRDGSDNELTVNDWFGGDATGV